MIRRIATVAVWAFLILGLSAATTFAETPEWQAQWIGATTNHAENTWSVLRKHFTLRTVPKSAVARIAVDSKYWLWINGKQVVFEGGLKRGPNPSDTYYDEVDLAPWLRKGDNTIAVLAWFWGKEGFSHKNSGKAGFLFELNAGNVVVMSDASWKALVHPAYGTPAGEKPNFRLPECNVRFDARNDLGDWTSAKFNDSAWLPALQFGAAGVAPWNELHPRPIPQWKNYGLKDYLNVSLPLTSTGQVIVAKLPYNAQVTPWLRVEAGAGQTIDIRSSNYRGGGEPNIRAEYVTRDGVQEYESLGWFNGQDVLCKIPAGVKVLGLKYRETGYDTEFSGAFTSDDPFFNQLWQKSIRTLYVTMRDNFMDCPDRERAQWWGDAVNELGETFYSLSPSSGKLIRKAIYDLCGWQKPDKTLYSPIPSTAWTKELPQQMLASISQYGFWTYYFYTGDKQTVLDAYPHVRDYLSIWKLDDQGLLVHRNGNWNWADWGDNIDERVLDQAWYCLALQGAANMARLAAKPDEAVQYETTRSNVIAAVNTIMWNGSAYRTPTYKGATDDRANALCVVAGIADSEKLSAIQKILATEYHASPYMEKYVIEALMLMGDPDAALARMKKRYGAIVADEWTTLPELWVAGTALTGQLSSTRNHAWSGGPLTILSQYVAGLAPLTPAWATYQVRPQMGALKKIDATVDSVAGKISVSLRRDEHAFSLALNSPKGTTAQVYLPCGHTPPQSVTANGRLIWNNGQSTGNGKGVKFKETANGWMRFEVVPGNWEFELTAAN
jgi:alpha-L-rhamnosidase